MSEKIRRMIKQLIISSSLSQNEIARRAGMSSSQMSVYMTGKSDINTATAERILNVLGYDPSVIKQK